MHSTVLYTQVRHDFRAETVAGFGSKLREASVLESPWVSPGAQADLEPVLRLAVVRARPEMHGIADYCAKRFVRSCAQN